MFVYVLLVLFYTFPISDLIILHQLNKLIVIIKEHIVHNF